VDFNREKLRLSLKLDGEYPMGKTFPQISTDFFGHKRSSQSTPGPFARIPGEDDVIDLDPRMIEK
jgi:hypothetical protein